MAGGGPFDLQPGQWTDDTSMALCFAKSLIERVRFDPTDQMERYVRWWPESYLSSTGSCFDIGNTVRLRCLASGGMETPMRETRGPGHARGDC